MLAETTWPMWVQIFGPLFLGSGIAFFWWAVAWMARNWSRHNGT